MSAITGARTSQAVRGACALLLSPLHPWDPAEPVQHQREHLTCTGQVMLEGRRDLAVGLALPHDATGLHVVTAAVRRWGSRCAEHFNGEYAFAAWDAREQRLICARDGFGVRLLYVGSANDAIVISNVIDAVVAHPSTSRDVDGLAILTFLAAGSASDSIRTPYRAVRAVPEGHTLTVTIGRPATLDRHWWMPQPDTPRRWSRNDIVEGYRDVLRAAVDDRIERAPATIFLSGGVDSTTIAAAATDGATRLRALTVEYARADAGGEVLYARRAAEALTIPWSKVAGDRYDALHAERDGAVPEQLVDEPTLADWRAALAAAATMSTVAIYGENGDALFAPPGGRELLRNQSRLLIAVETLKMVATAGRIPYLGLRVRDRLLGRRSTMAVVPQWLTAQARRILEQADTATVLGLSARPLRPHPTRSALQWRLIPTIARDFAPLIGAAVTRQRLEVRLPLLDTRVLRYVMSVPPIPWCQRKQLPRAAFREWLPPDLLDRPKTGVAGFNEALVNDWRRLPGRATVPPNVASVDPAWIDDAEWIRAASSGSANEAMAAWRLLMAGAWLVRSPHMREHACTR